MRQADRHIVELKKQGLSILLSEQNIRLASSSRIALMCWKGHIR